jgi:hypothetical protein
MKIAKNAFAALAERQYTLEDPVCEGWRRLP